MPLWNRKRWDPIKFGPPDQILKVMGRRGLLLPSRTLGHVTAGKLH